MAHARRIRRLHGGRARPARGALPRERALHAIEILNEPRWDVPTALLEGILPARLRGDPRAPPPERVAVVFHDGFRSHREYLGFPAAAGFENVCSTCIATSVSTAPTSTSTSTATCTRRRVVWKRRGDDIQRDLGRARDRGRVEPRARPEGGVALGAGAVQPRARAMDAFQEQRRLPRLRGRAAAAPSSTTSAGSSGATAPRPRRRGASATASNAAGCRRVSLSRLPPGDPAAERSCDVQRFKPRVEADRQHPGVGQLAKEHLEDQPFARGIECVRRLLHEYPAGRCSSARAKPSRCCVRSGSTAPSCRARRAAGASHARPAHSSAPQWRRRRTAAAGRG